MIYSVIIDVGFCSDDLSLENCTLFTEMSLTNTAQENVAMGQCTRLDLISERSFVLFHRTLHAYTLRFHSLEICAYLFLGPS